VFQQQLFEKRETRHVLGITPPTTKRSLALFRTAQTTYGNPDSDSQVKAAQLFVASVP